MSTTAGPPAYNNPSAPPQAPLAGGPEMLEAHEEEKPTASHALADDSLANLEPGEPRGASQIEHGDLEVKNLGWNDEAANIPRPVVGGIANEDLWTLVRRFNKQVFHVRSIEVPPLGDLDMNIADDEEFSPDKLRAQLERLYMVVITSLFALWKHVVRLRSWRERRRTSAFLAVYAAAWLLNMVIPTLTAFLLVLVLHPPSRSFCFPPAPPALIDSKSGGVKKPPAGVLASDDSITGAPEKHQGEAVELEARSFVNSISTLVMSTAVGKDPQADPQSENRTPDPTDLTADVAEARDKTMGHETNVDHNRTKAPVSRAVWDKARPTMHMVADLVDTWERMGNALRATPPFPRRRPRLALAAVIAPLFLGSCFLTSYMMMKGTGFGVGFAFFGDPIITPALAFINKTYPRWQKYVELRNTILKGVPTNAQLAITLLRVGEKNRAPIPPPPGPTSGPPPVEPHATAGQGLDHLGKLHAAEYCKELGTLTPRKGVSEAEIDDAIKPQPEEEVADDHPVTKPKKGHRIINMLKGTTKGGIQTLLTADKAKAAVGARHARNRLGVVKNTETNPPTGPIRFPARYHGHKGHAYITATATTPALSWTSDLDDVNPAWTVTIGDIDELRKLGGLGWKSKIVVGWAMQREIMDGLLVRTKRGEEHHLTAISMRDELFNRLLSMGSQMWEAM
ncbi:hypothetical protein S40293_04327 [Stachybotrys chartarum IBT 40293]|nr:hypothetical protein S40293_04327 [Stachybotrys chartarum IBT 40293]